MTWYELIWFCAFPVVWILGIAYDIFCKLDSKRPVYVSFDDGRAFALVTTFILFLAGGLVSSVQINVCNEFKEVKATQLTTVSTTLTNDGLDVVFSDHTHKLFSKYWEIEKWKTGGKFYERELKLKRSFGPDESKKETVIR